MVKKMEGFDDGFEADMGYKMSMAEFKGATINALQNINNNIALLQQGQQKLQNELNSQKLIASIIGGFSGIIASLVNPFKQ